MKEIVERLQEKRKSLEDLTTEEIDALPNKFLCVTRYPGYSTRKYNLVFRVVDKSGFLQDPEECFLIDSRWGYARPYAIYIATPQELNGYEDEEIASIKEKVAEYRSACIK